MSGDENTEKNRDNNEMEEKLLTSSVPHFQAWIPKLIEIHKILDQILDKAFDKLGADNKEYLDSLPETERDAILNDALWADIQHTLLISVINILLNLDDSRASWEATYKRLVAIGNNLDIDAAELLIGHTLSQEGSLYRERANKALGALGIGNIFG